MPHESSNTRRAAENKINNSPPDYNKLPPQEEGPIIKTAFVTTNTIRLKVETIERLQKLADLGSSWDHVISKLVDCYDNNTK
jgi:hypothetical protein